MPIDPTGTAPGLPKERTEPKPVHIKCRNPKCTSNTVIEVKAPGSPQRMYRCTKCHATHVINVGGGFDL